MSRVARDRHRYLPGLKAPFERVLLPLGFRVIESGETGRELFASWASDHVLVDVSYEPHEVWGQVRVGRRWSDAEPLKQPYWSKVSLQEILRLSGVDATSTPAPSADPTPEGVAAWATAAARDLASQSDVLRGERFEVIDRAIAELSRVGVRGLDYPA